MNKFTGIKKTINKVNYYQMALETVKDFKEKKNILIHACCAPCVCWPLEFLLPYFNITVYYNNSNIYPSSEYQIRMNEVVKYIETFNQSHQANVKIIVTDYQSEKYHQELEILKDEPEGGKRCLFCYSKRMNEAYKFASENNFDYFCTVMTISRQKNSQILNQIGHSLEKKYPNTKYFYSDFKKKQGIDKAVKIQKEHDMYRQQYCGCKFSYEEYLVRKAKEN